MPMPRIERRVILAGSISDYRSTKLQPSRVFARSSSISESSSSSSWGRSRIPLRDAIFRSRSDNDSLLSNYLARKLLTIDRYRARHDRYSVIYFSTARDRSSSRNEPSGRRASAIDIRQRIEDHRFTVGRSRASRKKRRRGVERRWPTAAALLIHTAHTVEHGRARMQHALTLT